MPEAEITKAVARCRPILDFQYLSDNPIALSVKKFNLDVKQLTDDSENISDNAASVGPRSKGCRHACSHRTGPDERHGLRL
jgi:hypothetical protein